MDISIRRAIAALTFGDDAQRHFDLAAERIQHALLDVEIPVFDDLELGVHAEPARLVGGDYIDLYQINDRIIAFALGDASGKSLAAAMTALMLRYLVRGLISALGVGNLAEVMRHANAVVSDDLEDGAFITFLLGIYDGSMGAARIVNAGHEPPLLLRRDAPHVETVAVHGIVLGIQHNAQYEEAECALERGDLMVTYTDGLTEATNDRGELFTMERLSDELVRHRNRPAQEIAEAIFKTVHDYSAGELRDDATILVMRRR